MPAGKKDKKNKQLHNNRSVYTLTKIKDTVVKFQCCLVCGIAACRAMSVFALLFRLRGNPSAGAQEREVTVVYVWSLHLFLCHDTNAFACAGVHTLTHTHTHSHTPPTVNKAVQSGHNHSKAHKRLPSVSLSLPVRVNEPHWQQFILHYPNTITFNITV